jgi:hypothetical protein
VDVESVGELLTDGLMVGELLTDGVMVGELLTGGDAVTVGLAVVGVAVGAWLAAPLELQFGDPAGRE